jgi:hypothetical protein
MMIEARYRNRTGCPFKTTPSTARRTSQEKHNISNLWFYCDCLMPPAAIGANRDARMRSRALPRPRRAVSVRIGARDTASSGVSARAAACQDDDDCTGLKQGRQRDWYSTSTRNVAKHS